MRYNFIAYKHASMMKLATEEAIINIETMLCVLRDEDGGGKGVVEWDDGLWIGTHKHTQNGLDINYEVNTFIV